MKKTHEEQYLSSCGFTKSMRVWHCQRSKPPAMSGQNVFHIQSQSDARPGPLTRRPSLKTWWRHPMEIFPALLAICAGNSLVPGEFSARRPVTRSFDSCFDLRPNNGWVYNGEAGDLGRHRAHYDVIVMKNTLSIWGNPPVPHFSTKTVFPGMEIQYEDKTVVGPSYYNNAGKKPTLYWDGDQASFQWEDTDLLVWRFPL